MNHRTMLGYQEWFQKIVTFPITLLLVFTGLLGCGGAKDHTLIPSQPEKGKTLRYRVVETGDEKRPWRLVLNDAPSYAHVFPMAPEKLEPELHKGDWLVLAVLILSVPDLKCIQIATSALAEKKGTVSLGVRPMAGTEEIPAWFPAYGKRPGGSPLWVAIRNGKVKEWKAEPLTDEEAKAFVDRSFP